MTDTMSTGPTQPAETDQEQTDAITLEASDSTDEAEDGDESTPGDRSSLLVREGDIAADYLERLLDIVDYDGDIDLDVENGRAMVAIVGSDLQPLIGAGGATLSSSRRASAAA